MTPERTGSSQKRAKSAGQATPTKLSVAGLFAGIGGIELGLHQAGHETTILCEIDPGAQAVLRARFPGVMLHPDITTLEEIPAGVTLLAGGFPCQDLSQAGMTRGIAGQNSGLITQVFRLLARYPVEWILLENVPFMLQLGGGRALEVVVGGLEKLGYRWAYRVVDTRAFGLPQRRERVIFVASSRHDPRQVIFADEFELPMDPPWENGNRPACGFYWTEGLRGLGWAVNSVPTLKGGSTVGVPSPPAIWMPDGSIVTPTLGDAERLQGFPKDWTRPAESAVRANHRWKLVGNAVSVPVAKWLGTRFAKPGVPVEATTRPIRRGDRWPRAAFNVGEGRFAMPISSWPESPKRRDLAAFLSDEPKPLSARASAGFLERARRSSLRFPPGFLTAVERHLDNCTDSPKRKAAAQ